MLPMVTRNCPILVTKKEKFKYNKENTINIVRTNLQQFSISV
jgi:hypothetical protein